MDKKDKTVTLKVIEAKSYDAGRGIARIDPEVAYDLGLQTGDVIGIEGAKRTAALVWPGYPEDGNTGLIRIDGTVRRNAGVSIDDKVQIRKIHTAPAEKILFSPTQSLKIQGGEAYLAHNLEGRVITRGDIVELNIMGRRVDLVVVSIKPVSDSVIIGGATVIEISEKPSKEMPSIPRVSYEDIGGLGDEVKKVREMIELPLRHPEIFERLGVEAPKGVLLHGPPGTGKTLLAKALASETNANFITLSGPEIMSKFYGESEEKLRDIFQQAEENSPSIILIDEIDSIAPKREEVTGEVERRIVAQLLAVMDGLKARGKVVVIGATNRPNAIDPALRRPGRFDREIEIGVPDRKARFEIMQIHTRGMPVADDVKLDRIADLTHGFVGADLAALTREAAMNAIRRLLPELDLEVQSIPSEVLGRLTVTGEDFKNALREMTPSALREVFIECPNIHWSDIGGLPEAKQELKEAVEWPMKYPMLFKQGGARPPKGILLYGPPGTGKTMLAKAVATESEANFISVKGPEFMSKWVGESEKAVRETFRKAKQAAPCIIFFDEIDSIAPTRGAGSDSHVTERVISQMLSEIDGLEELHNITVIAATNRPDIIDPALLRPGRIDRLIYVMPPDRDSRLEIFKVHTAKTPLDVDVDLETLADDTNDFTGADIASVCNEATILAIREYVTSGKSTDDESIQQLKVGYHNFRDAMTRVKPYSKKELEKYTKISENFIYQ
ncbi:MAG: CDC48 family AAA ATPase [Candidatus Methanoperedens sp.]|nr:CDC48 family AAA ATPase [Candidatus Methanoperedens sp.]